MIRRKVEMHQVRRLLVQLPPASHFRDGKIQEYDPAQHQQKTLHNVRPYNGREPAQERVGR